MKKTYDDAPAGEIEVGQLPAEYRKEYYTVEERDSFDEGFRTELHDGLLIVMESPVGKHQRILIKIAARLENFLEGKPCKVYPAPFDVRLSMEEETVFQPDIIVVCDKSKTKNGKKCLGAPDLVIEILSTSTSRTDRLYKFNKFQKAGVREYWIIDPEQEFLQVNILTGNSYIMRMYEKTAKVPVSVLQGCEIDLAQVFGE